METKYPLQHPTGKKAVRMDKNKYEILKRIILHRLKTEGELTNTLL